MMRLFKTLLVISSVGISSSSDPCESACIEAHLDDCPTVYCREPLCVGMYWTGLRDSFRRELGLRVTCQEAREFMQDNRWSMSGIRSFAQDEESDDEGEFTLEEELDFTFEEEKEESDDESYAVLSEAYRKPAEYSEPEGI